MGKEHLAFSGSTSLQESARDLVSHLLDTLRFEVSGREHLDFLIEGESALLVFFPHCGHLDAPAVRKAVPSDLRKQLVFPEAADYWSSNPLRSKVSSLFLPTIPMSRKGSGQAILDDLDSFGELLMVGYSIVLSPEGTRSSLPLEEREFRTGPAELILRAGCPVIPVRLRGFEDILPRGTLLPRVFDGFKRKSVSVVFGPAIRFEEEAFFGARAKQRKAITQTLREALLAM